MSEEQKKLLEQKLWNIANILRGKMDADAFRDYILGFIFYKYLSERQELFANDNLKGEEIEEYSLTLDRPEYLEALRKLSVETLGFFLKPDELFKFIAKKRNSEGVYSRRLSRDIK